MSTTIELYVIAGIVGTSMISASLFYGIPGCKKLIASKKAKKEENAELAAPDSPLESQGQSEGAGKGGDTKPLLSK